MTCVGRGRGYITFNALPVGRRVAPLGEQYAAARLCAALAALPAPWVVLANCCASGAGTPPWARFIALHPGKGIALVDTESPEAAVAPLEDFLSRTELPALRAGAPPIVPVAVGGGEIGAVADMLDVALAPMSGMIANPNWQDGTVDLLLTAPDLMLAPVHHAAPAHPSHPVEFPGKPLWRIGTLRPDSALVDWPPRRRGWLFPTAMSLFLVAAGGNAIWDGRAPPFFAAAMRPSTATVPHRTVDALARAVLLPRIAVTRPATMPTLSQLTVLPPKLATPPPPAPPFWTVMIPQPKPVAPDAHATPDQPPPLTLRPKIASTRSPATVLPSAGGPAQSRGGGASITWYDRAATTVSNAGLAALVAPAAREDNLISANLGTAHLASGTTATLDFYGDGLVNIATSSQALARAIDPSTGKPLGAAVGNTRTLKAASGSVFVTANVAANVVDDVVNTSGIVQARSASEQNGQIVLNGGPSGSGDMVQVAVAKNPSANSSGEKTPVSGGAPENQGVVYTTTTVTVAQDVIAEANSTATSIGGTVTGAVVQGATDANAITASAGTAVAAAPSTVTHVSAIGSTLTNTMSSLAKPVTSLVPALR